jgi:formamidopyrimidine-DNA glycosylase
MPELPEVETTRLGIYPFLVDKTIQTVIVRQPKLRVLVPNLNALCRGKKIVAVLRRGKYLLLQLSQDHILIHLGMSGHLRLVQSNHSAGKHDHIDLLLNKGLVLRYNDPRRFGLWLYLIDDPYQHPLLRRLGPEPLSEAFNPQYLHKQAKKKQQNIKSFIMRNEIVVGVGNIYATESLFFAKIHPQMPAGCLNEEQCEQLVWQIKRVLSQAISAGGTTLRDFYAVDGKPGYFANSLQVYGRKNCPCFLCQQLIQTIIIAGRNSAFCPTCQPYYKAGCFT